MTPGAATRPVSRPSASTRRPGAGSSRSPKSTSTRSPSSGPADRATAYAHDVVAGRIVAGRLVRLACQRHLDDIRHGPARGLRWDPEEAEKAIRFFGQLRHYKGEWAGRPIDLGPWQCFLVGSLWGWRRADGTRRFRIAYIEVGRKNGKSTLCGGLGIRLAFYDGEPGAEVYAAATKKDQAKIVWGDGRRMVLGSPLLRAEITAGVHALTREADASRFVPLGADADTLDGLNVHGAIVDELHKHRTREVLDVLDTASGARRQPLRIVITTAGLRTDGVWAEEHDLAVATVEGRVPDDSTFVLIYTLDDGDDPFDERVWPKANPNLGVSVKIDELREQALRAKAQPAKLPEFLRLRLNVPTTAQVTGAIPLTAWDAMKAEPAIVAGTTGYGGLDLGTSNDLSAYVAVYPAEDGILDVAARFWTPAFGIEERERSHAVPYRRWADEGWITLTEGNVTDYDVVVDDLLEHQDDYPVADCGYDPAKAASVVSKLQQAGMTVTPVRQGFITLHAPTNELLRLVAQSRLRHGGNPVLRWMVENLVLRTDAAGNLKPDRANSRHKIDGVAALVNALERWLAALAGGPTESVYETRDLLLL